jgi:hypothetical protein
MKNQLGVRDQDVRPQYSQGGSPLAISSLSDAVNRRHSGLIQETLDGGNLILESEDRAEEDALERGISFMDEDALRVFDDDAASHVLEGAGVDADA